jgi:NitT/TauT family transport system ATP-binding protein
MIALQGVSKIFPGTGTGLDTLDLEFNEGEWVSLLGPSGCGKSTLLRLIAGLDVPTSGEIRHTHRKDRIGFVFQDPALLPWLTVQDNVALPLVLKGKDKREAGLLAQKELERLRIPHHSASRPHELSGGIKMRVSLARTLIRQPDLILLDEPFAALDEPIRIELGLELRDLFTTLKPTVLMVTHSITEGLWLSDRTLVLQGQPGRVVLDEKSTLTGGRTLAKRGDPEFLSMVERCFDLLRGGTR